uniref:Uncharacterized protein n=1 Tax=Euplotes harpa TaxID=151035 RepID=A0A7S3J361_9SPIT|mmetsp:Transcript_14220/g.16435  ORF Transcript_14220/g.16435 Transcript_14220/m.16435 type:complete len:138 (+) Transcript_14220:905-1318(+)
MLVGLPPFYSENRKIMFNNILYHEPDFPESLSAEVVDLMEKLLEKDPKERLGSFSENCEGIVQHKWFEVIDFDSIASKSMKPPFIPDMSKDGLNYFDEEFTSTNIQPQIDDFSFGNSLDSTDDFFSDFDFQMTEDTE